jgi:hypothetical protein
MFLRRLSWAQLTKGGVPPMVVLRPLRGGFTPPNIGDDYPAPDPGDKSQLARARQLYEQRRIGTKPELDLAIAKAGGGRPPTKTKTPASPGKGKAK